MSKFFVLFIFMFLLGAVAGSPALAHGRVQFGFYIGGPLYYPPIYRPYYYTPYVPYAPPVYIQQPAPTPPASTPAQPQGSWYYCEDSKTYYPYVKECPAGWQRVPAPPPR